MKRILYTHEHLKDDYPQTHGLLDELMDVQLIDNTGDDAIRAWREIETAAVQIVTPLEQELSFLKARVKLLESEIDKIHNSRYAYCVSCGEEFPEHVCLP